MAKKSFFVTIVSTVERTFSVKAEDEEEAIALCLNDKGELEEENDGEVISTAAEEEEE